MNNSVKTRETDSQKAHVEEEVQRRYQQAAQAREDELCCPVDYEPESLAHIPQEIAERDYGCGNPTMFVRPGETVVDLGSGSGKICYILAQKVGPDGFVYGIDFNDEMLRLARQHQPEIAKKLGYNNARFAKAKIQDLALDLDRMQDWLKQNPVRSVEQLSAYDAECERLRREEPLIADNQVDVIVSNCVLNLVRPEDKIKLFAEMNRVLRPGGRAVISDIVCDEDPTPVIMNDPQLWSGCISGAFREDRFLQMFEDSDFYGVEVLVRQDDPWRVIDGIEFRSMTVQAYKIDRSTCLEQNHAVMYKGPFQKVYDEEGHIFPRGRRVAVCGRTYRQITDPKGPYAGHFVAVPPYHPISDEDARPFDCTEPLIYRHPRETKGQDYNKTTEAGDSCCGDNGCC